MSLTQYLLEFSICLALFYGLYHFLLRGETFFQLNRWYLLLSPVAAMVIPFLDWQLPTQPTAGAWEPLNQIIYPLVTEIQYPQTVFWQTMETPPAPAWNVTFLDLLLLCYLLGVVLMGYRLLYRTWKLMQLIGLGRQEKHAGYTTVSSEHKIPAASFLSYIFWQDGPMSPERKYILEHELVHVRQWHSLDVLLMEIWVMLKWFHPMIYWYRNSLRLTHEYIADAYVSRAGGSKLEYARLLAGAQSSTIGNPLLHHFDSSVKMRLLMLAKKQSGYWKYLRFLSIVPVTVVLLVIFSFNLAEELPDPVVEPLVKAEQALTDFANRPLLSGAADTEEAPLAKDKVYTLKWGNIECECRNEQFPNFYRCENQSLLPNELRRVVRKQGGFQLFLQEQAQQIQELTAVSKYMKDMGGFQGQFDEMGQAFNEASPLWKQAEKGDVFNFTFHNGNGDYFEFEVVMNNRKDELIYGSRVEIGDFHFSINLTNESSAVHLDLEELKRLAGQPLRIRKNNDTYYQLSEAKILNRNALRQDNWSRLRGETLDISASKAILEAFPGDQIGLSFQSSEGEKIEFLIMVRSSSPWSGEERDFQVLWGSHALKPWAGDRLVVTKPELEKLLDQPIYLYAHGRKHLMKDARMETNSLRMIDGRAEVAATSVTGPKEYVDKVLKGIHAGQFIYLRDLNKVNGYLTPPVFVQVDHDWKEIFKDKPGLSITGDDDIITVPDPSPEDLQRILDVENFNHRFYTFQVDGQEFDGFFYSAEEFRKLAEQGLPRKTLTFSRRICTNCK